MPGGLRRRASPEQIIDGNPQSPCELAKEVGRGVKPATFNSGDGGIGNPCLFGHLRLCEPRLLSVLPNDRAERSGGWRARHEPDRRDNQPFKPCLLRRLCATCVRAHGLAPSSLCLISVVPHRRGPRHRPLSTGSQRNAKARQTPRGLSPCAYRMWQEVGRSGFSACHVSIGVSVNCSVPEVGTRGASCR